MTAFTPSVSPGKVGRAVARNFRAAERATGVAVFNEIFPIGHLWRYASLATVGNGVVNDTVAFAAMFTVAAAIRGVRAYVPAPASKYKVNPLLIPSNVSVWFERGCIVEATTGYTLSQRMFSFDGASNVRWHANGFIARMLIAEYGPTDEQRHCYYLVNCDLVHISDAVSVDAGGDGFYINGATRLRLDAPAASGFRRDGISIIKATVLTINGTARFDGGLGYVGVAGIGVNFEPNGPTDSLKDIVIDTIAGAGNFGKLVTLYLDDYQTGSPEDVTISIRRIVSRDNDGPLWIRHVFLNAGSFGGLIDVGSVESYADRSSVLHVEDKAASGPMLHIGKVTAFNPCLTATALPRIAAVYIADTSNCVTGGIYIDEITIKTGHGDMDWGVYAEMGLGFTDVRLPRVFVRGAVISPIRFSNINPAIAAASTMLVAAEGPLEELPLTVDTTLTCITHYGRLLTNTGSGATRTHQLSPSLIPPAGNPYRFRVTEAQTMVLDVGPSDRIVGTTVAGNDVRSSVVGAEIEIGYVCTVAGIRYWSAQVITGAWVFS